MTQKMQQKKCISREMYKEAVHAYVLYHTTKYVINYLKNLHCWILLITLIILHVFQENRNNTQRKLNTILVIFVVLLDTL